MTNSLCPADNEYSQSPISHAEYFADLKTVFYNSSIVVPLTANDANANRNWIRGTVSTIFLQQRLFISLWFSGRSRCLWVYPGHLLRINHWQLFVWKHWFLPAKIWLLQPHGMESSGYDLPYLPSKYAKSYSCLECVCSYHFQVQILINLCTSPKLVCIFMGFVAYILTSIQFQAGAFDAWGPSAPGIPVILW